MGKSAKKRLPASTPDRAATPPDILAARPVSPAPPGKKAGSAKATKKTSARKSTAKKQSTKKPDTKKLGAKKPTAEKIATKKIGAKKPGAKKLGAKKPAAKTAPAIPAAPPPPLLAVGASPAVLDRLWTVISDRRTADPALSHSARLLARGTAKVAQKFGEEAVECVIEAVGGNRDALVAESADVLYHLLVMWVDRGVRPSEVWAELQRREGVSGVAEKAARALPGERGVGTTKIP